MAYATYTLDISNANTYEAHDALIKLLRKFKITGKKFLYRGTCRSEIVWLKGKASRPVEPALEELVGTNPIPHSLNSICCYTFKEMLLLQQGKLGDDNLPPVEIAGKHGLPAVLIYEKDYLEQVAKNPTVRGEITSYEYRFKSFKRRYKSLFACINLTI